MKNHHWSELAEAIAKTVGHEDQVVEYPADPKAAHRALSGLGPRLFRIGIALRSHYDVKRGVLQCWGEAIPDAEFMERMTRRKGR